MATNNSPDGPSTEPTDADLERVIQALREFSRDTDRVTLCQLDEATYLDPSEIEALMGSIETRKPVRAKGVEVAGATLAWELRI